MYFKNNINSPMLLNLLAFLSGKHILIKDPSYIWYSLDVSNYLTKYFPL